MSELLTLQEAADALGCHYMTLYRRVRGGEVEALLAGGRYRIRREVLEPALAGQPQVAGFLAAHGLQGFAEFFRRQFFQHGGAFHWD